MMRKLFVILLSLILLICAGSFNNAEETITLEEQIIKLKKENEKLIEKINRLETENKELKNLLKEQDKILTTLAKSKIFTKKVWSSIAGSIKDLSKRVNRKIKKIEKNKKKVKKKQMEINRKDLRFS